MIQLLESAINQVKNLPDSEQEKIALLIIKEISKEKSQNQTKTELNEQKKEAKPPHRQGTGNILRHGGKWVGDDLKECLEMVYASRGNAEF
jgi:hypothetical protein